MPDLKIDKIYKMGTTDWIPLIDAMGYLSYLPQCGDVAQRLHDIFVAAKEGKYYFIEIGYEDQEGKCFVVGHEFEVTEDGSKKIVSSKSSGSPSGAEPLDKIVKKKE